MSDPVKEHLRSLLTSLYGEEQAAGIMEEQEETAQAARDQAVADAQIFFEVFGTGRGPELLEVLRHKTTYLSVMDRDRAIIDGNIPLNPAEFMAGREMQNALIRFIERMILLAQKKDA